MATQVSGGTDKLTFRLRPLSRDEFAILHGDDESVLGRIKADESERKFVLRVEDNPKVEVVFSGTRTASHSQKPESKIPRNWRIDTTGDGDKFVVWNASNRAEVTIPISQAGSHTPSGVHEIMGQDQMLFEIGAAIDSGMHIMLTGPTGTGKSTVAAWFAQTLGWNLVTMPISRGTESAHLVGEYMPDGQGGFAWVDGPVTTAVRLSQTHPTILLIDEINRIGNVAEFARIYSLLDNQKSLTLPEKRNGSASAEVIKTGNLVIIATANPTDDEDGSDGGADYSGVIELDPALVSRFPIQPPVPYPDPKVEAQALANRVPNLDLATAQKMVAAATRVRKSAEVRFPLSFRELEAWARMTPLLGTVRAAEITVIQKASPMFRADLRNLIKLVS